MTGLAHLYKDFRHVAELSDKERIHFIDEP